MPTDVLIVSRTRMSGNHICVGAIELGSSRSLRLIPQYGYNWPSAAPFQPGQAWSLTYTPRQNPRPPHVEDVVVTAQSRSTHLDPANLRIELMSRQAAFQADGRWWAGNPSVLFQGMTGRTGNGSRYIEANVPTVSTGFWVPSADLIPRAEDNKVRFYFDAPGPLSRFPFVGDSATPGQITAGALCRMSLARWDDYEGRTAERCYVQLSGVY